jgi:hypothetical protein
VIAVAKLLAATWIAIFASAVAGCASKRANVTEAWVRHAPQAILVLPIDSSGHPEVVAPLREAATRELGGLGYGTLGSTASLHIVVERWTSPAELLSFGEEHIVVAARLYDNASGELLWSATESQHACEDEDDDDDEDESVSEQVFDGLLGWVWANTAGTLTATSPRDVADSLLSTLPPRPQRIAGP